MPPRYYARTYLGDRLAAYNPSERWGTPVAIALLVGFVAYVFVLSLWF